MKLHIFTIIILFISFTQKLEAKSFQFVPYDSIEMYKLSFSLFQLKDSFNVIKNKRKIPSRIRNIVVPNLIGGKLANVKYPFRVSDHITPFNFFLKPNRLIFAAKYKDIWLIHCEVGGVALSQYSIIYLNNKNLFLISCIKQSIKDLDGLLLEIKNRRFDLYETDIFSRNHPFGYSFH